MFVVDLLKWWYGSGWAGVLASARHRLSGLGAAFSTVTLLKTLFAPWKRIITNPGAGLDEKLRAFGDNLISRLVGFSVRIIVLLTAGVSLIGLCLMGLAELVIWPLLPVAGIALIVWGVA